jgi:hypothetical protein
MADESSSMANLVRDNLGHNAGHYGNAGIRRSRVICLSTTRNIFACHAITEELIDTYNLNSTRRARCGKERCLVSGRCATDGRSDVQRL